MCSESSRIQLYSYLRSPATVLFYVYVKAKRWISINGPGVFMSPFMFDSPGVVANSNGCRSPSLNPIYGIVSFHVLSECS